jgi:AcrR family transcriptional regulator
MSKAFSEQEKQWIARQLLEEGARQFSAHGLKKTTVEEIATAAGISKAAFYGFYESKEALFMDAVELAETHFRQQVLAAVDRPGPSPRARLVAVLKEAFTLWKTIPLLQLFTRSDFDLLFRRVADEQIQEHMANDLKFMQELIARCREAGILVQAQPEEISGLLYALLLTALHEDDLGPGRLAATFDLLLELAAAFCLGEVGIDKDAEHEPGH